jgi:hypothetical protein
MPIDINAAERFVHAAARLLDRHRLAAPMDRSQSRAEPRTSG